MLSICAIESPANLDTLFLDEVEEVTGNVERYL